MKTSEKKCCCGNIAMAVLSSRVVPGAGISYPVCNLCRDKAFDELDFFTNPGDAISEKILCPEYVPWRFINE